MTAWRPKGSGERLKRGITRRVRLRQRRLITGFTLIEVMVALLIVALAIPALLFSLDQQVDGTAYLRDRSISQIVASNRMSELRLALSTGNRSLRGRLSGSEDMAGRSWFWSVQSEATEVPDFTRVEVQVRGDEEDVLALYTLVAFLATPAAQLGAGDASD